MLKRAKHRPQDAPGLSAATLHDLLTGAAARSTHAMAILAPGRPALSYGRLLEQVQAVGEALAGLGIGREDRVALVLPNGPEMAVAFLGVAASATCAPLNPAYRTSEFGFCLSDIGARALIVLAGAESPACEAAAGRGIPIIELTPRAGAEAGVFDLAGPAVGRPVAGRPAGPKDVALLLHTSGTTSRPKLVPLTHANLWHSARFQRRALGLTGEDRCLNVMPLFHMHAISNGLMAALGAGGSVVCTPAFEAPRFFQWVDECRPNWYTAVPAVHQAILDRAVANRDVIARRPLRLIRSASAPLPPTVMAELERTFNAPVLESYGLTETATVTCNPRPPRLRKPGTAGVSIGLEVAVVDEEGNRVPAGRVGEIIAHGPSVVAGYENNPEANARSFVDGWLRTGDLGSLDADGYLTIEGRIKEIINRGGEKIAPREIEEALLGHPAVAEAVAFAMPDARLGEDVAAAVVLREGASAGERELREHVALRLTDSKVPRRVVLVKEVPKGPTGKLQRAGLAQKLGLTAREPAPAVAFVAPRTPLERTLAGLWCDVLGLAEAGVGHGFVQLGGDSVLAARLIARVRDSLGVEIPILSLFEETSTIASQAELIAAAGRQGAAGGGPRLTAGPPDEDAPLSLCQEEQWFLQELDPLGVAGNRAVALRLRGRLDIAALEEALGGLLRRHEMLRTSFPLVDGRPVQRVGAPGGVRLPVVVLSGPDGADAEARALAAARQEVERPFDLTRETPARLLLLRLGGRDHVLLLITHHIIFDGWSRSVFARDVAALYAACAAGRPSPLDDLPVQYGDFARWQREMVGSGALDEQTAYWKKRLGDEPPILELPADHARPVGRAFRGDSHRMDLSPELTGALGELGRREGATLFMTLLAAFKALLHRYTGQEDVVVGTPAAGRGRSELEDMIGHFVNMLVLRTDLSGGPSFRELVGRVRRTALDAFAHQDVPFGVLVQALQPRRGARHASYFQVVFALQNLPAPELAVPGLDVAEFGVEPGFAPVDLALEVSQSAGGLRARFEYDADLFDAGTIARMAGHLRTLLEGALADPDCPVSRLPLLTEPERRSILVERNRSEADYPRDRCIHELFEEQVRRAPSNAAAVCGDETLTYAELNARANRLARHLIGLGVGPEKLVGICVERSLDMLVGLLGVLKAGGAYVPIEPDAPAQRQASMLSDSGASVLITRQGLAERLPQSGARLVLLDRDREAIGREPSEDPRSPVRPDNLAYVIYTSGSTGRPKGVAVSHTSLVNHAVWTRAYLGLDERDRALVQTAISFDLAGAEIYPALLAGARLVLADAEAARDGAALVGAIRRHGVTTLNAVPSQLRLLVEEPGLPGCTSLRAVISGGEALPLDLERLMLARCGAVLYNAYGPTEATIDVSVHRCSLDDTSPTAPLGYPLANVQAYVLDRSMQPVPMGVPGELHVGGAGLARGYVNQPELTAARFVANPFGAPGERLYKTGDLVRLLADRNMEFLGRLDHQVKVRGHRIELGEIEAALARHPHVRAAVVLARLDRPGDQRLVAYIVLAGRTPSADELRDCLAPLLPDYMVPSTFAMIDQLPLTPNRKVDRSALPAPAHENTAGTFVAPRTPLEEALAAIWRQVLGLGRVGVEDDFFVLGGHSLLAAQVLARTRDLLQTDVSLRTLFESRTVAALARAVVEEHAARLDREAPAPVLADGGGGGVTNDG